MPRGGARPGAGRPRKDIQTQSAAQALPPVGQDPIPRPVFTGAEDFGVWALNASDREVSMDQKIRAMQVLAGLQTKQPKAPTKEAQQEAAVKTAMSGRFAPRQVRGFSVVDGAKK